MTTRVTHSLAAGCLAIALSGLAACSPAQLNALLGAAQGAQPGATASTAPGAAAASPAPGQKAEPMADPVKDAAFAAFKAKVDAAGSDPERMAKLFVAAFSQYKKDAKLAKEMMTLAADAGELTADPTSRSGFRFIPARDIYWTTVDRNPALGLAYLKTAADADGASPEDSVVIDTEYAAQDKGVNGDRAKFFIALQDGSGKRPRPVSLVLKDGRWRVNEFSSIVVQI